MLALFFGQPGGFRLDGLLQAVEENQIVTSVSFAMSLLSALLAAACRDAPPLLALLCAAYGVFLFGMAISSRVREWPCPGLRSSRVGW